MIYVEIAGQPGRACRITDDSSPYVVESPDGQQTGRAGDYIAGMENGDVYVVPGDEIEGVSSRRGLEGGGNVFRCKDL